MFPIPFNFPYRKKDGSVTTMETAIAGGGAPYSLPTASASKKGGIKIGNGLTMSGETLNVDAQLPSHSESDAGKVLTVGNDGSLEWDESGGVGGGFVDARTLETGTADINQQYFKYYICDVRGLSAIIPVMAYDVTGLKSGYQKSKFYKSDHNPPTDSDFTLIKEISAPSSGKATADYFDVSNCDYVYACVGNASQTTESQCFAGYCPATPYSG